MKKLNCKNCKRKCCEGYLYNKITGESKVILPVKVKFICTEGIQLVRISRLKWKCRFFKRGKCSIYKERPFLCKMWFCRDHPKKIKLREFYHSNSILELQVIPKGRI
jgi:Fe-S-cluster containining protein